MNLSILTLEFEKKTICTRLGLKIAHTIMMKYLQRCFCKPRILLWLNFIRWNRYENLLEWCLLCKIPWKLKFAYIFMQILWFDTIIYFTLGSQHSVVSYFHSMIFPLVLKANFFFGKLLYRNKYHRVSVHEFFQTKRFTVNRLKLNL